jgi:hypothetical protein
LTPVAVLLVAIFGALFLVRAWLVRGPRTTHVTWGCGYVAPTPRMQYSAASYSASFAQFFENVLHFERREKLPHGPFPEGHGHLNTHNVDTTEKRIFEAFGQGEDLTSKFVPRLSEEPRFAFGFGLVVVTLLIASAVAWGDFR